MTSDEKTEPSTKSIAKPREYSIVSGGTVFRMLFFTLLMVTLPISSYFVSKHPGDLIQVYKYMNNRYDVDWSNLFELVVNPHYSTREHKFKLYKYWVFEGYLELSQDKSIIPSALTAVVMVHIVLGLFIYAAYTEDIPKKPKQA